MPVLYKVRSTKYILSVSKSSGVAYLIFIPFFFQMLGLMGYSTLHCVRGRGGVQVDVTPNPSITATSMRSVENKLADVNLDQQNGGGEPHPVPSTPPKSSSKNNRFFIYCKDVCEKMQPGKLRVRCSSCGDESFVLSKVCWPRY